MLEYAEPEATNCAQLAPTITELIGIYRPRVSWSLHAYLAEEGKNIPPNKINLRAEAD